MADTLVEHVRDGTFPESNEILGQEVTSDGISSLLSSLIKSRDQLKTDIGTVSQNTAGDVDEWILQAKKLQEDIARCKVEARQIVEEHERGQQLRSTVKDASNKVHLLESEIAFTKVLEHEIQNISEVTGILNEVERDVSFGNAVSAVSKLVSLRATIENIPASKTRSLLTRLETELLQTSQKKLEEIVDSRWMVVKGQTGSMLTARSDAGLGQPSDGTVPVLTSESILNALQELHELAPISLLILRTIDSFISPIISCKTGPYPSSIEWKDDSLSMIANETNPDVHKILAILRTFVRFLHSHLPLHIRSSIAQKLLPKMISNLISSLLDPALPLDLYDLQELEPLQREVSEFSATLEQFSWPGSDTLRDWVEQIPRGWLAKRRIASLDAVRSAFSKARGTLRPVERVERQTVTMVEPKESTKEEDDWDTNWEDEPQSKSVEADLADDEGESSGWDFDTEDDTSKSDKMQENVAANVDEEDVGDAWGWGDDDPANEPSKSDRPTQVKSRQTNGEELVDHKTQEMVLTETYHITDIPDYILEIIGKDIADSSELQVSASKYFATTSPATGLAGLPNLTLALFRATAPTYYTLPSATYTLTNINLYNDTLYIIQRLNESSDSASVNPSIQSLTKFARQVYSAELDTQRTVVADLLDGAQGFDRCTTFPGSQACIDAVSSTIDRLRQLHKEWSGILGESHLLQSLGSLMTMVFGKIIKDVEDMDDISEAESKQLVVFCQQILSLEDLFASRLPNLTQSPDVTDQEQPPSSQILLYVPNYLRFQYLQQILESSLVDIKYLWTEGEMSLEFSVDEVVDLIKALFAESQHRRSAIRDIKARVPG